MDSLQDNGVNLKTECLPQQFVRRNHMSKNKSHQDVRLHLRTAVL